MVLATLIWGATFVAARDVLRAIAPLELVFARFAAATAVFAVLLALRWLVRARAHARPPGVPLAPSLVGGAVAGVFAAGGYLFQAVGLTTTSAGSSAFLTCVGTVLAALFAWPLLGQRPAGPLLQGMVLAIAGSFLMGARSGALIGMGEAWTLLGAVVYALQIVALARWAPRGDALLLAFVQAAVITLVLSPFAERAPAQLAALEGMDRWRFAYLAVGGSVLAPLLQILAQRTLSAGRIALLFTLEPVFGLAFALTLGGERFGIGWWIGALLILSGVIGSERRARS